MTNVANITPTIGRVMTNDSGLAGVYTPSMDTLDRSAFTDRPETIMVLPNGFMATEQACIFNRLWPGNSSTQ